MFTLTFYGHGTMDKHVVAATSYKTEKRQGYTLILLPNSEDDGLTRVFTLRKEQRTSDEVYREVWITNLNGKTIDHFTAPDEREPPGPPGSVKRDSPPIVNLGVGA